MGILTTLARRVGMSGPRAVMQQDPTLLAIGAGAAAPAALLGGAAGSSALYADGQNRLLIRSDLDIPGLSFTDLIDPELHRALASLRSKQRLIDERESLFNSALDHFEQDMGRLNKGFASVMDGYYAPTERVAQLSAPRPYAAFDATADMPAADDSGWSRADRARWKGKR